MPIRHLAIHPKDVFETGDCVNFRKAVMTSLEYCVDKNIPLLTLNLFPILSQDLLNNAAYVNEMLALFDKVADSPLMMAHGIHVNVVGSWYNLPELFVEKIKAMINATSENHKKTLTLCINYGGQEEIAASANVLARKVLLEKLSPEDINVIEVKNNIQLSGLAPPDVILVTGGYHTIDGFLLWDSASSRIEFVPKKFRDISFADFDSLLSFL